MKVLINLIFLTFLVFANVNEYKSDVYFANGIMMKYSEKVAKEIWEDELNVLLSQSNLETYNRIDEIKIAYNASKGFFDDLLESLVQLIGSDFGLEKVSEYFEQILGALNIQEDIDVHNQDLQNHIKEYKETIKAGKSAIVIAHSQGNYYTNEAYLELDVWMKNYFYMFGVASPAAYVSGYKSYDPNTPHVKFHNDFINSIITSIPSNRKNPNESHKIISAAAHDFYTSYLDANNTKEDIKNFILEKINLHSENNPSQYEVDEVFDYNTKDYLVSVKHKFDSSLNISEKVMPFDITKKLYTIPDSFRENPYYSYFLYVLANEGGTSVLTEWEEQEENQVYKLDDTEDYIEILKCQDGSKFKKVAVKNEKTCEYKINLQNILTNETIEDVYPFKENGNVYQLESGEWVQADCGGINILKGEEDLRLN